MRTAANGTGNRWLAAWPDLLAFAGGLSLAWFLEWETTDLVWSLWLSSLLVGYAMIVWSIFGRAAFIGVQAWRERDMFRNEPKGRMALGGSVFLIGGLFMLAFFTVHFGFFHYVHSIFLNYFFPVTSTKGEPGLAGYLGVLRQYWYFVPLAALAERQAFRFKPEEPSGSSDTSVKAADIAARKARNAQKSGMDGMMAPYRNVIRLHMLIFFFAAAHFAKLENFLVYAIVYAVYFFPWRLVKKPAVA
jgi:hypothetical protein